MTPASLLTRSTAVLTLAGALSAAPLHLTLHPAEGFWPVAVPAALARGGDDDGGSDDSRRIGQWIGRRIGRPLGQQPGQRRFRQRPERRQGPASLRRGLGP